MTKRPFNMHTGSLFLTTLLLAAFDLVATQPLRRGRALSSSSFAPIYINAGGSSYTDSMGNVWSEDQYFNTGTKYTATGISIAGTTDDSLFLSERYDTASGQDLVYDIPVPNGDYDVTLYWAENYATAAGVRVFSVSMEGAVVFSNVDIFAESGGRHQAMNRTATSVTVSDGSLTIEFGRIRQNPKVGAITITAASTVAVSPTDSSAPSSVPSLSLVPSAMPSSEPSMQASSSEAPTTVSSGPAFVPIYINAGGSGFTDSNGNVWIADSFYNTGTRLNARAATIIGTVDQKLYKSERFDKASGVELRYDIPTIPTGEYNVSLHFSENYSAAQKVNGRVFNVSMEGEVVFPYLDIFAESGGPFQVLVKTATVSVVDGSLTIDFARIKENPKVSGIEIHAISTYASSPVPLSDDSSTTPSAVPSAEPSMKSAMEAAISIRINAGGGTYTDSSGLVWDADNYYNTGRTYTAHGASISGTEDSPLFRSERYDTSSGDDLVYEIPVPNGDYEVILFWAETYATAAGVRVFSVSMEDVDVFPNVDIFDESGGKNMAMNKTATVTVSDGSLTISFGRVRQNPKISSISIRSMTTVGTGSSSSESSAPSNAPSVSQAAPVVTPVPSLGSYAPSTLPSSAPSTFPSTSLAPSLGASSAPAKMPTVSSAPVEFEPIYINVGADSPIVDPSTGITWEADNYYNTGLIATSSKTITGTSFEEIYRTERYDEDDYPNLQYSIPLPDGRFQVKLHFADIWKGTWAVGARTFNVYIEDALELEELDIFARVGKNAALVEEFILDISDGTLDVRFEHLVENPKLNAIEVHPVGAVKPHYAHSVPGGPYAATDITNSGDATIAVNGFFSHTHKAGAHLTSWIWKVDDVEVAYGEQANITLGVGEHTLILWVQDSVGDSSEDFTTVTIQPYGYPFIESLTPAAGDMIGGDKIIISGHGFTASASETIVNFGPTALTGSSEISVVDDNTIEVLANPQSSWGKVEVTVTTPLDTSNPVEYEYLPEIPLTFKSGDVKTGSLFGPTAVAFGPDGNMYVATQGGDLIKYILDETHHVDENNKNTTIVANVTLSTEYLSRAILGLTFDPTDTCPPEIGCSVYISHSTLYHNQLESYNGVVSKVSGLNLDAIEDIITGLPISDHDHGINGLEFDDNGNLYIQVGGNTNAGVPGALSTSQQQEENLFSAATLIARNVTSPSFDGHVTYDANGDQLSGFDVGVFASGMRNPYGIAYHSNGRLYGTDNGPNTNFGKASISCTEDNEGPEPFEADKLNLIEEGHYYGHANRKRGETDPRQCSWRKGFVPSDNYTMPIKKLDSSSNGLVEFQSNHFGGALRGDLVVARYKGALHHVKLTNGGIKAAGEMTDKPPPLINQGGLDVTQGPDGTLFVASNFGGKIHYHAPDEAESELMTIKSIFPRRGPQAGGSTLTIYGQKMFNATNDPTVTVGGLDCPVTDTLIYTDVTLHTMQWIKCRLPASGVGSSDVVVSFEGESHTFQSYRYISGGL